MNLFKELQKFLHFRAKVEPEVNLNTQIYLQLRPFTLPLILTVLLMMLGTLGYLAIEKEYTLLQAIYQTGITFTTVGFGEEIPLSPPGKLFTITLIILGFAVFSFSVGLIVESMNKGEIISLLKERSMLYKIVRLKNHFVLCYHNEYTIQVANQFRKNHIPFVVIDPREDLEEIAKQYKYPYYIKEEPHTQIAMLKSYLSSAKGLISLSENIADNIAQIVSTRLYEKELKRIPYFIVTNAKSLSDIEKLQKLGADKVISPTKLMAQKISTLSIKPDMDNILDELVYTKDTPLSLQEIKVPIHSWMIYKKINEIKLRKVTGATIIGMRDETNKILPMPKKSAIIGEHYSLLIIGTDKGIKDAKKLIRKKYRPEELRYA